MNEFYDWKNRFWIVENQSTLFRIPAAKSLYEMAEADALSSGACEVDLDI